MNLTVAMDMVKYTKTYGHQGPQPCHFEPARHPTELEQCILKITLLWECKTDARQLLCMLLTPPSVFIHTECV
ncbi:hypothetical protein SKAU_G00223060 [Synaphobranchus kaupii]|uniref:Uncharacterized protein n=1 Tax=Synaphobranchus kaupii TaxID=118154 RepID=A0A9Q1IVP3_SYNKA|nr:hypothetical protein SKAU_G00223060 [Synaphobranchus kaupii]